MAKTIAQFSIDYFQYLTADGTATELLQKQNIDIALLKHAYQTMVLTRAFDTKAIALQRTGKLGTYASSLGQEAVSVGIGLALQPQDVFCPAYRDYGAQMLRGVAMAEILAFWSGSERGNAYQAASAKADLPNCIPIGSQCLHAAGIATAMKLRQQRRAVLVTCGDGATSQGDFYETLNVAGVWHLPLVMVIVNNQWAISIPRHSQSSAQTLAQKAIAAGIPGEQIDGNDFVAVYHRIAHALEKARQGGGATVIEALTYRLSDHTTADDASRYRDQQELSEAWQREPLLRLRQYLVSQHAWSETQEKQLQQNCIHQVEQAVSEYTQLNQEPPENIFDFHYETLPDALRKQREEFLADVKN